MPTGRPAEPPPKDLLGSLKQWLKPTLHLSRDPRAVSDEEAQRRCSCAQQMEQALQGLQQRGHDIHWVVEVLAKAMQAARAEAGVRGMSQNEPGTQRWALARTRALEHLDQAVRRFLAVLRDPETGRVFARRHEFSGQLERLQELIKQENLEPAILRRSLPRGRPRSWAEGVDADLEAPPTVSIGKKIRGIPRANRRTLIRILAVHNGLA